MGGDAGVAVGVIGKDAGMAGVIAATAGIDDMASLAGAPGAAVPGRVGRVNEPAHVS